MGRLESELGGVLDGDDPFLGPDAGGQCIEQRGLSGSSRSAHHYRASIAHRSLQHHDHFCGTEPIERYRCRGKPPDREIRTADGQRGNNGVHTGPIGQTGINVGRSAIDPETERTDHPVNAAFDHRGRYAAGHPAQLPGAFDPDLVGPVDHHFGDLTVREEGVERTEADDLCEEAGSELLDEPRRQQRCIPTDQLV